MPKAPVRELARDFCPSRGIAGDLLDLQRFRGTVCRAVNWLYVGNTKDLRRTRKGYTATAQSPKMVFVKPLQADRTGGPRIVLNAEQMQSLSDFFAKISKIPAVFWPLQPGQSSVGCVDTGLSRIGPKALAPRHGDVSSVATKTAVTSFQASMSSAIFLSVSIPYVWTAPYNAGIKSTLSKAHYHFTVKENQPGLLQDIELYSQDRQQPDFVDYTPPDLGASRIAATTSSIGTTMKIAAGYRTSYGPENMIRLRRFAIRSVAQKMRELTRYVRLVLHYLK